MQLRAPASAAEHSVLVVLTRRSLLALSPPASNRRSRLIAFAAAPVRDWPGTGNTSDLPPRHSHASQRQPRQHLDKLEPETPLPRSSGRRAAGPKTFTLLRPLLPPDPPSPSPRHMYTSALDAERNLRTDEALCIPARLNSPTSHVKPEPPSGPARLQPYMSEHLEAAIISMSTSLSFSLSVYMCVCDACLYHLSSCLFPRSEAHPSPGSMTCAPGPSPQRNSRPGSGAFHLPRSSLDGRRQGASAVLPLIGPLGDAAGSAWPVGVRAPPPTRPGLPPPILSRAVDSLLPSAHFGMRRGKGLGPRRRTSSAADAVSHQPALALLFWHRRASGA
ncbi:hypothetical protein CDD83_11107 [Cordyceps sp. RAO-2017]|nr:hypothetical protein CDD83_11107 [Cordyceps sp. RAO-2017]